MKVRDVLRQKASDEVIVGDEHDAVLTATTTMAANRVGLVVIVDADRRILGTLSESDVIRAIAASGMGSLSLQVSSVMNRRCITCSSDDEVRDVMATITRSRQRQLPVVEDGVVVGVISIGDVMKSQLELTELENRVLRDYYLVHH